MAERNDTSGSGVRPSRADAIVEPTVVGSPKAAIRTIDDDVEATISAAPARSRLDPHRLARGQAIGRYLIVERLGAGAMGVVFRAYDPDLDRSIAVKFVAFGDGESSHDDERSRLLREAQAMARLSHPNVITVYDVGIIEGAVFVAMEFVEGTTLRTWLETQRRSVAEVLEVFGQAGRGLAAAHRAGLVHRDFKPDNVMVGSEPDGHPRARVLDFGLARAIDHAAPDRTVEDLRSRPSGRLTTSMTGEGSIIGTPAYMSPEQHTGAKATALSDQFSFCVALWEGLYGRRPFKGETLNALAFAVLQRKFTPPPSQTDVPAAVHRVVLRGLGVDPSERFESMDALLAALQPPPKRIRRLVGVAATAGGLAAVIGVIRTGDPDPSMLCRDAEEALAPTWSPARRDEIGQAFARTQLSFANETWTLVARSFDDYGAAWVRHRTEACEATRLHGTQSEYLLDLRMACLDRGRRELDALLGVLQAPDGETVARAFDAARALPPVETCSDLTRLQAAPATPSPEQAEEVERLRNALSHVDALRNTGKFKDALRELEPVLSDAEALGYVPLLAEALATHADLLVSTEEGARGREVLGNAFERAVEAGDDALAADLAREMAFEIGYGLSQADRGRDWARVSEAMLARLEDPEAYRARLWSTSGAIHTAAGEYSEALERHSKALDYYAQTRPQSSERARTLDDIGAVYVRLGELDRAIALHREALGIKRTVYGDHHPEVAATQRELGTALSQAGQFEAARVELEAAFEIEKAARGESHKRVATLLDDLGRIHRKLGDLDQAIEMHRRALEIWRTLLGDPNPDLAVSILNIGYTLNAAGRFEEALAEFERALHMVIAAVGENHPYVVYASNAAASALVDLRRYDAALVHVERVLALDVQVDPTLLAETQFIGTHALWAEGSPSKEKRARAIALARQARAAYALQAERWAPQLQQIDAWLRAHAGPGQPS